MQDAEQHSERLLPIWLHLYSSIDAFQLPC